MLCHPFHCRLGNQKTKSINAHQAGAVSQKESVQMKESDHTQCQRAARSPSDHWWLYRAPASSNASAKVTARLRDKSYVLSFGKILALTDCFLLDSCYLFKMNDITQGVPLSVSYHFAFSYCSWGSQGKNTEVVCHSLLQWTTYCLTSPP